MLGDVVAAALEVGHVIVVTDDHAVVPSGVEVVPDPQEGQGSAVLVALAHVDFASQGFYLDAAEPTFVRGGQVPVRGFFDETVLHVVLLIKRGERVLAGEVWQFIGR